MKKLLILLVFTLATYWGYAQSTPDTTVYRTVANSLSLAQSQSFFNQCLKITGGTMTGKLTITQNGLGTTATDALLLQNTTAAANNAQQTSPSLTFRGYGWGTTAGTSQTVDFRLWSLPSQGGSPAAGLTIQDAINGAAWNTVLSLGSNGTMTVGVGGLGVGPIFAGPYSGTVNNLITTSTDGIIARNNANGSASVPVQISPRLRLTGAAWTGSASQFADWIQEVKPINGTNPITSRLVFSSEINAAGYNERFGMSDNGLFYLNGTALTTNQIVGANSGATGMEGKTLSGSTATGLTVTNGTGTVTFSNDTTKLQTVSNFFSKADTRYLRSLSGVSAGGDLSGAYPNPTVAKFNGQLPAYYLNYTNLTNTPTTLAGFGITDAVSLTGSQTITNKTISGSTNTITNIPNSALTNSTISGVALGSNLNSLAQGTGISSFTYNGSTAATVAVDQTFSPTWTGVHTFQKNALAGIISSDVVLLQNTTAAANNAQQASPALHFTSNGWGTTAGTSQTADFRVFSSPAQGNVPGPDLYFQSSSNGSAWNTNFQIESNGTVIVGVNGTGGGSIFAGVYNGGVSSFATTSTDGIITKNSAAATAAIPVQYSPRLRLTGNAWNGSVSQAADWIQEVKPVAGTNPVTSRLAFSSQVNATGYNEKFGLASNGLFYLNSTALTGNQIVGANSGATGMEAKTLSGSTATGLAVTNGAGTITFSNDTTNLQTIANFYPKADSRYLKTSTASATYQPLLGYTAANDANVVHLTGNESIAGTKTFTGKMAIGTSSVPTGYQFAVNGNTIATSVTVQAQTNWPDYVFAPQYKLRKLGEVATYIQVNHHLPDMPSAAEVAKNGQDLGDINAKLAKKVEELTLYLIEKDKQLDEQKKTIESQEERLQRIEKQMNLPNKN